MKKKFLALFLSLFIAFTIPKPLYSQGALAMISTIVSSVAQLSQMLSVLEEQYSFLKEREKELSKVHNVVKQFKSFEEMTRLCVTITNSTKSIVKLVENNSSHLSARTLGYISQQISYSLSLTDDVITFGKIIFTDDQAKMSDSERFAQTQDILKSLQAVMQQMSQMETSLKHVASLSRARRIL